MGNVVSITAGSIGIELGGGDQPSETVAAETAFQKWGRRFGAYRRFDHNNVLTMVRGGETAENLHDERIFEQRILVLAQAMDFPPRNGLSDAEWDALENMLVRELCDYHGYLRRTGREWKWGSFFGDNLVLNTLADQLVQDTSERRKAFQQEIMNEDHSDTESGDMLRITCLQKIAAGMRRGVINCTQYDLLLEMFMCHLAIYREDLLVDDRLSEWKTFARSLGITIKLADALAAEYMDRKHINLVI